MDIYCNAVSMTENWAHKLCDADPHILFYFCISNLSGNKRDFMPLGKKKSKLLFSLLAATEMRYISEFLC